MKIKTFVLNKNNKIEITEKELKQLLDEVYWEGYKDGSKTYTYTTPSWKDWSITTTPYYTITLSNDASNITIKGE